MTSNFRGLGTGSGPVLLWFATLLLGALALISQVPAPTLTSSGNRIFSPSSIASNPAADIPKVQLALGHLPLRFEPNQGQSDALVKFLARGAGYGLFLTPDEAVLTLGPNPKSTAVLRMRLAGANPGVAVSGDDQLPGKSNYFIGNNPTKWHRDIPQFARVRYRNLYPELTCCTTATRDNSSTTSSWLPAQTRVK